MYNKQIKLMVAGYQKSHPAHLTGCL